RLLLTAAPERLALPAPKEPLAISEGCTTCGRGEAQEVATPKADTPEESPQMATTAPKVETEASTTPKDEATTTPKDEATSAPKEEATIARKDEATTQKDEATTPKDEATTPKDEATTKGESTPKDEPVEPEPEETTAEKAAREQKEAKEYADGQKFFKESLKE